MFFCDFIIIYITQIVIIKTKISSRLKLSKFRGVEYICNILDKKYSQVVIGSYHINEKSDLLLFYFKYKKIVTTKNFLEVKQVSLVF